MGLYGAEARNLFRRFVTRKGKEIFVEASVGLRLDEADEVVGFRGIFLDVTSRRQAEEEKRRLTDQLQQAQKMEALGTLAGGIAHDFNNLLMGIQGRTSLMLITTDPSQPSFEHLKGVEEYVEIAASLTKQLLGFARGGKYEVKPTSLNELVEKSAHLFGRTKKEITIHNKFQDDLWTVEVDKNQIEQVLLNMFVNAWQAMPDGGPLYLQTENTLLQTMDVRPFGLLPGKYVKLSVTDTGVGMDETVKERIFEPFFTTKGRGRGTGLGLASAYGIIKNHGGIIRVYSEKKQGTTFSIFLPASEKEPEGEIETGRELSRGEGTILLVDDEEMILEVGKKLLDKLGYASLTASSGEEALEVYRKRTNEIDLVILDMIMPGMSGDETYDELRRVQLGRESFVVEWIQHQQPGIIDHESGVRRIHSKAVQHEAALGENRRNFCRPCGCVADWKGSRDDLDTSRLCRLADTAAPVFCYR